MNIRSGSHAIGPSNGKLIIKSYKDGMGAKLAHDLILTPGGAGRSTSTPTTRRPPARRSPSRAVDRNRRAVGGMKSLSDKDRKDIAKNINEKVLQTSKYPELAFGSTSVSGTAPNFSAAGNMTIQGTTRQVNVALNVNGTQVTARTSISQRDFGIKPFSAMMGAIKLRDDVDFELTVDLPSA